MAGTDQVDGAREVRRARNADELLTALYGTPVAERRAALAGRSDSAWVALLQEAADLCGVDAVGMSKAQAVRAVLENF